MSIISLINSIPLGSPAQKGYFLYSKVPPGILKRLEEDNFRKTIQFVSRHSPFYREKFTELGICPEKVRKPEDLGDFFTTAEDIRENPAAFVCRAPDTAFETTGTTSKKPKRVFFSRQEIREAGWAGAVGLWGLGVRKEDRVACAFDNSFWVSGPVLAASCEALGCFHVESGRMHPAEFYERLQGYGITVITGDPSWFVWLTEVAEKKGPRHKSGGQAWPLKLMLAGGENMTEETRRYIESVWKADLILTYGQTEAFGAIGMESRAKDGYHLNEFHNFFEIINPGEDGYGELVYTTLNRRVMPLVRYRSGDITRFAEGPSKAGMPGRRVEKLKGRVDEWVATAMGNIAPWMFETIFSPMAELGPDWQIEILKEGHKDLIVFHLESATRPADRSAAEASGGGPANGNASLPYLKEKILAGIRENLSDAWKIYEMGLMKFDLELHPQGTLRNSRKLKRIVDRRSF